MTLLVGSQLCVLTPCHLQGGSPSPSLLLAHPLGPLSQPVPAPQAADLGLPTLGAEPPTGAKRSPRPGAISPTNLTAPGCSEEGEELAGGSQSCD